MSPLLSARDFAAAYDEVPVVRGVSLDLSPGESVALLGRNGMGKTTLFRGLMGFAPVRGGALSFANEDIAELAPEARARRGMAYVPAERAIFGSLTVKENLLMCARPPGGPQSGDAGWTLDRVLALFPRLAERIRHGGHKLSGGEQQMLAIGRALMTNPRLLLIDEATEGLAPMIARDIWRTIEDIRATGMGAVIVDRDVRRLAQLVGRAIVLFKGEVVFDGPPDALLADATLIRRYIGL